MIQDYQHVEFWKNQVAEKMSSAFGKQVYESNAGLP